MYHSLQVKIASRSLRVAVIGLGYVGLPLAAVLAGTGFQVIGIDTDGHIVASTQQVRKHLHAGQLVVLESTTYPRTTDEVGLPELESTGLKGGKDFFLAFSPERIDPGNHTFGTSKGHCIPVDLHYLSGKLKTLDYTARFIELATEINRSMPHSIVQIIGEALNEQRLSFNGATVCILGVSYKRNVGDIRESPAIDMINELMRRKAEVRYNDEYVPTLLLAHRPLYSQPINNDLLRTADCIVIVADHSYYDVSWIIGEGRSIVDTRNMTRGYNDRKIFRLCITSFGSYRLSKYSSWHASHHPSSVPPCSWTFERRRAQRQTYPC